MGFPRQEYRKGLPFPTPGDRPDPGIKLKLLASPALAGGFFTTSATWEALLQSWFIIAEGFRSKSKGRGTQSRVPEIPGTSGQSCPLRPLCGQCLLLPATVGYNPRRVLPTREAHLRLVVQGFHWVLVMYTQLTLVSSPSRGQAHTMIRGPHLNDIVCIVLEEGMATHSNILAWRIPMDRGAWRATVYGVTKSQTQLSD